MTLYSVVVPVYNSEHTLPTLHERLCKVFDETLQRDFELLLVDDSSKDASWQVMCSLHEKDHRVKIYQMARNFGQPSATLCGFAHAAGDFIITMDDDLQHPPEELVTMIRTMDERDDIDVILGSYQNRKHNLIRRIGTAAADYATTRMLNKPKGLDMTSFRLIRRFIVDAILEMHIYKPQIGNLILAVSNHIINVPVRHDQRAYGHSGYSFKRLAKDLYFDITTHSALPLILVRNLGLVTFLIAVLYGIFVLLRYLIGSITVPGFTTVVLLITASTGITLLSIGVLGEYMMHTLQESKKTPNYVLRDKKEDPDE